MCTDAATDETNTRVQYRLIDDRAPSARIRIFKRRLSWNVRLVTRKRPIIDDH